MSGIGSVPLIAQNYIKYERLTEITNFAFAGSDADTCDIFFDLHSILSPLYGIYDMSLDKSEWEIASAIINMIAHYRSFYWRFYRVKTRFYLVYSDNLGQYNKMYYPSYNEKFAVKISSKQYVYNHIKKNLNVVSLIAPYLNDVCYLESTFDTSALMCYIMRNKRDKEGSHIPSIIITKDMLVAQLVGLENNLMQNVTVFRPKKINGNDISYPIVINNLYEMLFYSYKVQFNKDKKLNNTEVYSLILACSKCVERDMKSVVSLSTIYNKFYEHPDVATCGIDQFHELMMITHSTGDEKINMSLLKSNVESRFKAIDAVYQSNIFTTTPERLNFKGFMNLYDPNGLHDITEKYFKDCPLNLERM